MNYKRWVEFESISERLNGCYCYHVCREYCHEYTKDENGETLRRCLCYENKKKELFPMLSGAMEHKWKLRSNYELARSDTKRIHSMYQESVARLDKTNNLFNNYKIEDYVDPEEVQKIKKRKLKEPNYLVKGTRVISGTYNSE